MIWLLPPFSSPPFHHISKLSLFLSLPVCRRFRWWEGGGGRAGKRSQIIRRRRESLVLYNPLTTLWKTGVLFVDDVYPYQGPDKEQLDEKAGGQNPHGDTSTKYCRQVRQIHRERTAERAPFRFRCSKRTRKPSIAVELHGSWEEL